MELGVGLVVINVLASAARQTDDRCAGSVSSQTPRDVSLYRNNNCRISLADSDDVLVTCCSRDVCRESFAVNENRL